MALEILRTPGPPFRVPRRGLETPCAECLPLPPDLTITAYNVQVHPGTCDVSSNGPMGLITPGGSGVVLDALKCSVRGWNSRHWEAPSVGCGPRTDQAASTTAV